MKRIGLAQSRDASEVVRPRKAATTLESAPGVQAGLHSLPEDLLFVIARYLLPASPYLHRPYGFEVSYFPIAPELRALVNWGATCKHAKALIQSVCKQDSEHFEFLQLASTTAFEFGGRTMQDHDALVNCFGVDPAGTPAPNRVVLVELHDECGVNLRVAELENWAEKAEKLVLRLHRNSYRPETAVAMARALGRCQTLKSLTLEINMPFPECMLDALWSMSNLRSLELRGRSFPVNLFARLAGLPAAAGLEYLDMKGNDLGSAHFACLSQQAGAFASLRFLKLLAGSLDAADCKSIGVACQLLKKLESLDLGTLVHGFDSEAAHGLQKSLRTSTKVTRLGWRNLSSDEAGMQKLVKALVDFESLSELRLSCRIDSVCAQAIRDMLCSPVICLRSLDLDACSLDEASQLCLAEGIKASRHLHEFRVAGTAFTDAGALALGEAVGASTSLLEWTLDDCDIDANSQAPAMAKALVQNVSLREFHLKIAPDSELARREVFLRVAQRFNDAVAQSTSLLHMTIEPGTDLLSFEAQATLAENRRRWAVGR